MNLFLKNRHRYLLYVTAFFGLFFLYLIPRFLALRSFSPFIDEYIYTRWAQLGHFDPAARFISLGDGKQPLYIWLVSLTMSVVHNPITAGRFVSLLAGFGT